MSHCKRLESSSPDRTAPASSSGKQITLSNTHLARAALQSANMTDPNFLITTPRLTISYLDPSNPFHCQFMINLWNTPEFITMLGGKPTSITTPSAAKSLIENRFIADHKRNGYGIYLVSFLHNGQPGVPIGTVSLMRGENSSLLAPDIGFAMLSEYMRKGYAVEAGTALIDYVGKEQGVT
ncbi:acyl-CoA N-acyltransferase, partial [Aureobasidium pullulans]